MHFQKVVEKITKEIEKEEQLGLYKVNSETVEKIAIEEKAKRGKKEKVKDDGTYSIVPPSYNQTDGEINLVDISGGKKPFEFIWTDSSGQVISTKQNLISISTGTYCVTITDANCCKASGCIDVQESSNQNSLSIISSRIEENRNINHFNVYPNPFRNQFHISMNNEDIRTVEILNSLSQVVRNIELINESTIEVSLNEYDTGLFIVKGLDKSKNLIEAKKIIKSK